MGRPRNQNLIKSIRTTVRLPSTLAVRLRELAERNMRSASAEVAFAMARYIESGEPAPNPPHWEPGTLEPINMVFPADIYDRLREMAFNARRSVNQEIVLAVERHIAENGGGTS